MSETTQRISMKLGTGGSTSRAVRWIYLPSVPTLHQAQTEVQNLSKTIHHKRNWHRLV